MEYDTLASGCSGSNNPRAEADEDAVYKRKKWVQTISLRSDIEMNCIGLIAMAKHVVCLGQNNINLLANIFWKFEFKHVDSIGFIHGS
jgi:hypothetical protein